MKRISLLCLLLIACGVDKEVDNNNYGYGYNYDVQGASGLRLRYQQGVPSDTSMLTAPTESMLWFFETAYIETEQCAGLAASGPLVIVGPVGTTLTGGFTKPNGTILLDDLNILGQINPRMRHESVHYLLLRMTGNIDAAHNSPLFITCGF